MRSLNIIIVAAVDLPEGGGDSTRLKTLANAIKEAGHRVQILLENPSGNIDEHLLGTEGSVNDIPFRYILGNVRHLKGLEFFTAKYKAVKLLARTIEQENKKQKVDIVWFNQMAYHTIAPLTDLCKKLGIKIVHSYEDERIKGSGLKRKLIYRNQVMADKFMTPKADALVVISYYLKEKYERLTGGNVPISVIPTVVDADKWNVGPEMKNDIPVLLYYGGFFGFDEIEKMIDAVKWLEEKGTKVKFEMAGFARKDPAYMEQIAQRIKDLGLSDSIDMKGFTKHDKLKEYIKHTNVLLGLRKDDAWSSTGLSTKLSEYLSTGRMVIATAIGDNTRYLENGKSAILLSPGSSAEELGSAILHAISNETERNRIGEEGRKVALAHFDTSVVKNNLNTLLYSICS